MINLRKSPWKNLKQMFMGLLDVIDGLSIIATLGVYRTELCMAYLCSESKLRRDSV